MSRVCCEHAMETRAQWRLNRKSLPPLCVLKQDTQAFVHTALGRCLCAGAHKLLTCTPIFSPTIVETVLAETQSLSARAPTLPETTAR
eukprot:5035746-Amphidinium_carterae.2